jgi:pimeloyl-ACP methyl ester carboxylesterase
MRNNVFFVTGLVALVLAFAGCSRPPEGLRMHVQGSGSPAVVLEAGLGDASDSWDPVIRKLAARTRVVAYDRAGLGDSPPTRAPRTARQNAQELHEALGKAGITPPYVLAGHSAGGFYVRVFASLYPDEVAALVLVDPTPEDFFQKVAAVQSPDEHQKLTEQMERHVADASPGRKAEWEQLDGLSAEVRSAPLPAGLPVTLLTGMKLEPGRSNPRVQALWLELHRKWVAQAGTAEHIVTRKSGHYIHHDEPELVIEAIRQAVEKTRQAGRTGG